MDPLKINGVPNYINPIDAKKDNTSQHSQQLVNAYEKTHKLISSEDGKLYLTDINQSSPYVEPNGNSLLENSHKEVTESKGVSSVEDNSFKQSEELGKAKTMFVDDLLGLDDLDDLDDSDVSETKNLNKKLENTNVKIENIEVQESAIEVQENAILTENKAEESVALANEERNNDTIVVIESKIDVSIAKAVVTESKIEITNSRTVQISISDQLKTQEKKLENVYVSKTGNILDDLKSGNTQCITKAKDPDLSYKFTLMKSKDNPKMGELIVSEELALKQDLKEGTKFQHNGIEWTVRFETKEEKKEFEDNWSAYNLALKAHVEQLNAEVNKNRINEKLTNKEFTLIGLTTYLDKKPDKLPAGSQEQTRINNIQFDISQSKKSEKINKLIEEQYTKNRERKKFETKNHIYSLLEDTRLKGKLSNSNIQTLLILSVINTNAVIHAFVVLPTYHLNHGNAVKN